MMTTTDLRSDCHDELLEEAYPLSAPFGQPGVGVGSVVLITLVVAAAFMATTLAIVFVQRSVRSVDSGTRPVSATQPITSTVSMVATYSDMVETQKMVLESTSRAVESINRTADLMLTVNAFLFTVMTAAGAGALWRASSANQSADRAARRAARSVELVRNTDHRVRELDTDLDGLNGSLESLMQNAKEFQHRLEELAHEYEQQRSLARRDADFVRTSLALVKLDEHEIGIRSEDPSRRWRAISAALEMSSRDDDVIRRKAVRVLGSVEEYEERVMEQVEDMVARDPSRGVRQEAKQVLAKLQGLCEEANAEELEEPGCP